MWKRLLVFSYYDLITKQNRKSKIKLLKLQCTYIFEPSITSMCWPAWARAQDGTLQPECLHCVLHCCGLCTRTPQLIYNLSCLLPLFWLPGYNAQSADTDIRLFYNIVVTVNLKYQKYPCFCSWQHPNIEINMIVII
jgi:EamA domain-containing membrane protein RarD